MVKKNTEEQIAKIAETKSDGTNHGKMIKAVRELGFYCLVSNNSSIQELNNFINLNLPVIINYKDPVSDKGHYSVAVGYLNGKIILNDPSNGKDFKVDEKLFLSRWHDSENHHKYSKWLMVLSTKKFNLGRQYFPKK